MELKTNQFINYFFNKYGLDRVNDLFWLDFASIFVIFVLLIGCYYFVAAVDNKNLNVKTKNKYYKLWKNQYFMIPYCIVLFLYTYIVFNIDIEENFHKYKKSNINFKNYTYKMFEEDLKDSKILDGLSLEESINVKEKIIEVIYNNNTQNIFSLNRYIGSGLAPIEIGEIKDNLHSYSIKLYEEKYSKH